MSLTHFFKSIYFPYSCKVPQTLELFCVVLTGEGRRWSEDCLMLYLACHCTRNIISISTCTDPDRLLKYLCGAFFVSPSYWSICFCTFVIFNTKR